MLEDLERWWRLTDNPLYVWEAITHSAGASPPEPLPTWCLEYLIEAAKGITDLSHAVGGGDLEASRAYRLVTDKLRFGRQGKKNAFSAMIVDGIDMRDAHERYLDPKSDLVEVVKRRRKRIVSPERARSIERRGRKLLGG